jgi:hypothetical protein
MPSDLHLPDVASELETNKLKWKKRKENEN